MKSLPDTITEEQLHELFIKSGNIRSLKIVRKDIFQSIIGITKSIKTFAFVCYFTPEEARAAKNSLNGAMLFPGFANKLFVDYHQCKNERNEFLKLKFLSKSNMKPINPMMSPEMLQGQFGGRLIPQARQLMNPQIANNPMMRNFPPNQAFMKDTRQEIPVLPKNPEERREVLGDFLYSKITSMPQLTQYSQLSIK